MVKVNQMNMDTAIDVVILSSFFAVLSHDFTFKVSLATVLVGGLYFNNGKLPKVDA
jgi:hypothetical protein